MNALNFLRSPIPQLRPTFNLVLSASIVNLCVAGRDGHGQAQVLTLDCERAGIQRFAILTRGVILLDLVLAVVAGTSRPIFTLGAATQLICDFLELSEDLVS